MLEKLLKYEVGCPNLIWQGRKMHYLAGCDWFLTKHFDLNTGQDFYQVQTLTESQYKQSEFDCFYFQSISTSSGRETGQEKLKKCWKPLKKMS